MNLRTILISVLLMVGILPAQAELLPRWEIGLGVAGLTMPDYRGSDEQRSYLLPFPYIAYRLDWLKVDRNGVRARLFDSDRIELNFSASATPPVRSNLNHAREGMPELRPMLELGPSLDINLWRKPNDGIRMDLRLPLRAAVTASSRPQASGWNFSPRLNIDFTHFGMPIGSKEDWKLGLSGGPIFADHRLNSYIYSVAPEYAQPTRRVYQARGGYGGTQLMVSLSRQYGNLWVGAYARHDSLNGAVFEESPLVKRSTYNTAGFALTWTLGRSSEIIDTGED